MDNLKFNVDTLRTVSNNLNSNPLAQFKFVLFPGWDGEFEGEQEELIRIAAKAILGENVSRDEGTYVSHKSLSALIHYIADMLE